MKTFQQFIDEGLDDSWSDGKDTVNLRQIIEITNDIPIKNIPISKLIDFTLHKDNPTEQEKIENSDLKYPILVFVNDDNTIKYILDGHHRIQKAIRQGLKTIKGKLINFNDLPDRFKNILK